MVSLNEMGRLGKHIFGKKKGRASRGNEWTVSLEINSVQNLVGISTQSDQMIAVERLNQMKAEKSPRI